MLGSVARCAGDHRLGADGIGQLLDHVPARPHLCRVPPAQICRVHGESVVVLGYWDHELSTCAAEEACPLHRVEGRSCEPGDEVLVAEVPLRAVRVAVMLVDRRARTVHFARIPLAGVCGDAVRTPVDEDAELAIDVPVRDLIAGGEGVPVGAERAFGDAGVDSPKDRRAGLLDGGGLGCHGRPSSVPPGGATMMDQTPISCEVIRSLSNCVPYLVADAMVR